MTPEAQRVAIAEACGWNTQKEQLGSVFIYRDKMGNMAGMVPNYLRDLNDMHEAEKILSQEQHMEYWCWLREVIWTPVLAEYPDAKETEENVKLTLLFSTAAQRAEAFLKTLGLWGDEL